MDSTPCSPRLGEDSAMTDHSPGPDGQLSPPSATLPGTSQDLRSPSMASVFDTDFGNPTVLLQSASSHQLYTNIFLLAQECRLRQQEHGLRLADAQVVDRQRLTQGERVNPHTHSVPCAIFEHSTKSGESSPKIEISRPCLHHSPSSDILPTHWWDVRRLELERLEALVRYLLCFRFSLIA